MTHLSVPLPTQTFLDLAKFLSERRVDLDPVDAVEIAIDYWIDNASWKDELLAGLEKTDSSGGYVWKIRANGDFPATSITLPNGTVLRLTNHGRDHFCEVKEDALWFEGRQTPSPSQFAHKAAGNPRDAWRDIWVKMPADQNYSHADELRKKARRSVVSH